MPDTNYLCIIKNQNLKQDDLIFDSMIFAGNQNPVRDVIVGGQHVVRDFRHVAEEKIFDNYRKTLSKYLREEDVPVISNLEEPLAQHS